MRSHRQRSCSVADPDGADLHIARSTKTRQKCRRIWYNEAVIDNETVLTPVEPAFSHFFDFPFDEFQLEAMNHIRSGSSVMVAAPTSSGKTVVAEYALWRAVQQGSRAIYTTPIKALSNQKRTDLDALFPGQVGLLTGDR